MKDVENRLNIIRSGCSFTVGWGNQFEKMYRDKIRHIVTGNSASGNDFITRGALHRMIQTREEFPGQKIICIVMFSGLHRAELRIEKEHPLYNEIVRNSDHEEFIGMNPAEFNHTDIVNQPRWKPKSVWLKSGGFGGQGCGSTAGRHLWETYYKSIHSTEERYIKLLENILLLQNTATQLDVDLILTTWQNLFYETERSNYKFENAISLGNIPEKTKAYWEIYPEHNYLWRNIDMDNWCFINDKYDSLGEFHVLNNFISPDGGHPSEDCYQMWIRDVLMKHIKERKLM